MSETPHDWIYFFETDCMSLMPGTTLKDLDETDIETLLPWYFWRKGSKREEKSSVVYRNGKPYKKVNPKDVKWLDLA